MKFPSSRRSTQVRGWGVHGTETGSGVVLDSLSAWHAYYGMEPSKIDPLDLRKDPKMWALWFREFLTSVFPRVRVQVIMPAEPTLRRLAYRCRSGTNPTREWKMKNWVQALKNS